MKENNAKGLMAFWTDIDEENILAVQKWHNCEHITERVTIPGFLVGRRYRGIEGHTYLMYYETTNTDVLQSEAYLTALNNSTPWTKKSLTYFKNNIRNIYQLITLNGKIALTEAPFLYIIRFNIETSSEMEILEWLKNTYLPAISKLWEVYRSRLYQIDEEISNIKTGEREIYGGGPGQQKYLLMFELASETLPKEKEWQRIDEQNSEQTPYLKNKFEEYSFLEFVMYAPQQD